MGQPGLFFFWPCGSFYSFYFTIASTPVALIKKGIVGVAFFVAICSAMVCMVYGAGF